MTKIVSLENINKYIDELAPGKIKKEEELAAVLKGINSPKLSGLINTEIEIVDDKKTKDKLKIYLKVYATKKALDNAGFSIDYSSVPIPINKGKP